MSKELIVSASRHETRVAILEDDQLVEIFHQREQEYSLAGSIHKGRVTRVLPGMQSAFVDIGLERDAFLYVSDFFEDNEEYDKIVSGVEDKILKLEKGGPSDTSPVSIPTPIEPEMAAVLGAVPGAMLSNRPASNAETASPSNGSAASTTAPGSDQPRRDGRGGNREPRGEHRSGGENREARPDNREGSGDRGGRGRRGRRRRPGGGGLPESKFFSGKDGREAGVRESGGREGGVREGGAREGGGREAGTRDAGGRESRSPSIAEPSAETTSDFRSDIRAEPAGGLMVLPGESISKYVGQTAREDVASDSGSQERSEFASGVVQDEHTEALLDADDAAHSAFHESGEQIEENVVDVSEEPLAEEASVLAPEPVAAFSAPSDTRNTLEAGTEHAGQESAQESAPEPEHAAITPLQALAMVSETLETTEGLAPEPESAGAADADTIDESESEQGAIEDSGDETELEAADGGSESAEGIAEATEGEGPEPARIPQSLTAALREQGNRLPHRVSRRSRRRQRGGERGGERGERSPEQQAAPSNGQSGNSQASGVASAPPVEEVKAPNERPRGGRPPREERVKEEIRPAIPSITDLLRSGQEIIVQIAKEPLGQKGARITSHIALPGRFLVYMPTVDHIGVSRKIPSDEERLRLKRILQTHRTGIPGGFIVRTAGENRTEEELRADMMFLYSLWMDMRTKAEKKPAPFLLHHDLDVVERILRDQLTSAFKTVWVDNETVYENVLSFVQRFQPAMVSRIKLYTRPTPIFDEFGITQELEKALRPKVWLKSGGYIVINQTEALVAIDINTGKYVGKSNRLEDTIVKINTDAIKEIVRQIRLRDLGGIIVVDFIDMDERKNRQKVMQVLEECMRVDRAPYKILQFNDFGLVAITRKRVKQSLERTLCSPCPYCESAGYVKSVHTVISEILQEAHKIVKAVDGDTVMLRVNPEVAKVLKSNTNDHLEEIESILGKTVMIKSDPLLHQTKFDMA